MAEVRNILQIISNQENRVNQPVFDSWHRLLRIGADISQGRREGCQLCLVTANGTHKHHTLLSCGNHPGAERARAILRWLESLDIPRYSKGPGACSLCYETDDPCDEVFLSQGIFDATEPKRERLRKIRDSIQTRDGHCKNKAAVRSMIAALCVSDNGFLGHLLAVRLQHEEKVDLSAENQVRAWFEHQVPFRQSWVPRLLFIFEMLMVAFNVRTSSGAHAGEFRENAGQYGGDKEQECSSPDSWF
jgi:hypothetical protein